MKRSIATDIILLRDALEALVPFAEAPTTAMELYPCHYGLAGHTRCGRCGRVVHAWEILERARALGMAVVA